MPPPTPARCPDPDEDTSRLPPQRCWPEPLEIGAVERASRSSRELGGGGRCSQQCGRFCALMLVGTLSSDERAHLTSQFSRGVGDKSKRSTKLSTQVQ